MGMDADQAKAMSYAIISSAANRGARTRFPGVWKEAGRDTPATSARG